MLDNLKQFLIDNALATDSEIKFNLSDNTNCVVLWNYGGVKSPVGVSRTQISTIQIKVLDDDMETAKDKITAIYDVLNNGTAYKSLNDTKANIYDNQPPFFSGRDEQGRYIYIFNITLVTER